MKIKVKFFKPLREITGKKEEEIHSLSPITLEELLVNISQKYGKEFTEYMYNGRGKVRKLIQILINGRTKELETTLRDGDTIVIFPPVGGG
jgi:molybdopterin synthase catalytic subunit/molybdopterin synthase sulfur carrier subunit